MSIVENNVQSNVGYKSLLCVYSVQLVMHIFQIKIFTSGFRYRYDTNLVVSSSYLLFVISVFTANAHYFKIHLDAPALSNKFAINLQLASPSLHTHSRPLQSRNFCGLPDFCFWSNYTSSNLSYFPVPFARHVQRQVSSYLRSMILWPGLTDSFLSV